MAPQGGSGNRLERLIVISAGVAALVASLLSFWSIWLQSKNYRKPLLQRYVIRILLMVPIYCAASWASVISLSAAFYLDPLRDAYEAFTIYTFLQLLINFLGGERSLIIMMNGRPPVSHPWPLNHCLAKVDIADPHTFLAVKRGILQYAYLKPVLGLAIIILKATDTYQEGYLGLTSGYLWTGIFYNLSVTLSLYSLAMFWVCMAQDLKPFRPMPKFLCIKLIIFASYWQGFFLSILQFLGAIPSDVPGYTPDNLAAAIQDTLICFEMPLFAISHWYAFSWHDYADVTISSARMPVKYALRDAFGIRDLIEDTKETFRGRDYDYRVFDSGDNSLAHEDSDSRVARVMEGMRYSRSGKAKYWIPKPQHSVRTPLLSVGGPSLQKPGRLRGQAHDYRAANPNEEIGIDPEDERLYANAKALEFGDWNYPVITAHEATKKDWMTQDPVLLTTSTNRNLFQPTKGNTERRRTEIRDSLNKGKHRNSSKSTDGKSGFLPNFLSREHSSSGSTSSGQSQLVDLIVEDTEAEEVERVRARKEGGAVWNQDEQKHFIRAYSGDATVGEDIRQGYQPEDLPTVSPPEFAIADDEDMAAKDAGESPGDERKPQQSPNYAIEEATNVWDSPSRHG